MMVFQLSENKTFNENKWFSIILAFSTFSGWIMGKLWGAGGEILGRLDRSTFELISGWINEYGRGILGDFSKTTWDTNASFFKQNLA